MSEDRFARLRELLALWPQEPIWEQLCALLRWWPESVEREAAIDYTDVHLERWPDSLRQCDISLEWPRFPYGAPSPLWRLGRVLALESMASVSSRDIAAWSEAFSAQHMGHITRLKCAVDLDSSGPLSLLVADLGGLQGIEALHVTGFSPACDWLSRICQQAPGLRRLRVEGELSTQQVAALAALSVGQQLQEIEIAGPGMSIEPHAPLHQEIHACLRELLAFTGCQSLALENIPLLPKALKALDDVTKALPLKYLDLSRCELYGEDAAWQDFLQDASLSSLEGLSLRHMPLPDACFGALLKRDWPVISSLSLVGVGLTRRACELLRQWPPLYQLKSLDLGRNDLRNQGFRALLRGPVFAQLQSLSLVECALTLPSMVALASTPLLPALARLNLRENDVRSVGVRMLAGAKHLKRLKSLDVSDNAVYWTGYKALATSPSMAGLEALSISSYHGYFEGKSMQALCHFAMPPGLRELRLSSAWDDALEPTQLAALAAFEPGQPILALSFDSHNLSAACMKLLAKAKHLKDLLHLDLSSCDIDVEGILFLARSKAFPMLQRLQLEYNHFGDEGISALAASKYFSRLLVLELNRCGIGGVGAMALAASRHLGQLRELSLSGNDEIDVDAALALIQSPHLPYLSKLWLSGFTTEEAEALTNAATTCKPGLNLVF